MAEGTAEAPAVRRAHTRCGPHSVASLPRCGPCVVCARLTAAPSSPAHTATAPHASPASSASLRFAPVGRLPRAALSPAASPPAVRETFGLSLLTSFGRSEARATGKIEVPIRGPVAVGYFKNSRGCWARWPPSSSTLIRTPPRRAARR
ncbi:hypothetical protein DVK07_15480 [Halorubrum sp. Atlit-26R]|nr:hypothetical protein DVK07_15480 [Halorubrum sp. Atlit-26R]